MTSLFPAALDAIARPLATTLRNAPGLNLSKLIDDLADAVEAMQVKLGSGASGSQSPPATNAVLRRLATGQSSWGPVVAADVAGAGAGDANTVLRTTTGTAAAFGKVATADIAADQVAQMVAATPTTTAGGSNNTTPAVWPEMSVSITTVAGGGKCLVLFETMYTMSPASSVVVWEIWVDGTIRCRRQPAYGSGGNYHVSVAWSTPNATPLSAGTHTVEAKYWVTSGSDTVSVLSDQRSLVVIEHKR